MTRLARVARVRQFWTVAVVGASLLAACGAGPRAGPAPAPTTVHAAVTTTTTIAPMRYTVARGETLTAIAQRFRVPAAVIAAANHLTDPNALTEGQKLVIPPAPPVPPVKLRITPEQGTVGDAFRFDLTGVKPGETVLFEIVRPDGGKFVGPVHFAAPDGTVSTTYSTTFANQPGLYKVLAAGNRGTVAVASFRTGALATTTTA